MEENCNQVTDEVASTITTHPGTDVIEYCQTDSKLPLELYSNVLDHIDDRLTLLSMLVLCTSIHSQAERALYQSIQLTSYAHKLFLVSILDTKRPHLAYFVRRYYLSQAPFFDNEFKALLTCALVTFVNLKYLSFWDVTGMLSAEVLPIEYPCPFQLHTFHWTVGTHLPRLASFLNAQDSLEVLWLFLQSYPFPVPTTSLQRLRTLRGTTKVITELLPGRRSITCVDWNAFSHNMAIDLNLVPSFSHIRILSLGILSARPVLGAVVPFLEKLEILELGSINGTEWGDLYKLTRLRTLLINESESGYGFSINPQEAFSEMNGLEKIDVRDALHDESLVYQRWMRGARESIKVSGFEAVWWREFL